MVRATGATSGTITLTFGSAVAAGNTVVVCFASNGNTANPVISGITLGGSADNFTAANTTLGSSGADGCSQIWYDPGVGVSSATSVAVSYGSGNGGTDEFAIAYEVPGTITLDRIASHIAAGSASWTSSATATTSQANEIFFGACGGYPSTTLAATGVGTWTTVRSTAGSQIYALTGYQVVSSTRTCTFSGTQTSGYYSACVATFSSSAVAHPGTATLTGAGSLTGAGTFAGAAALSGAGSLTGAWTHTSHRGVGVAVLSGAGTLTGTGTGVFMQTAVLAGSGTLTGLWIGTLVQFGALTGSGTLRVSGVVLGFPAALAGIRHPQRPASHRRPSVRQPRRGRPRRLPGQQRRHDRPQRDRELAAPRQRRHRHRPHVLVHMPWRGRQDDRDGDGPRDRPHPNVRPRQRRENHQRRSHRVDRTAGRARRVDRRVDIDRGRGREPGAGLPRQLHLDLAQQPARRVRERGDQPRPPLDQPRHRHTIAGRGTGNPSTAAGRPSPRC